MIHELAYFGGLDGEMPSAEGQKYNITQPDKQLGLANLQEVQARAKSFDQPFGNNHLDYLQRATKQLSEYEYTLRSYRREKIGAIGIIGRSVFDKLLLLQALRRQFPEAIFFTTDFDELYTMESELPWTRNLIISSSFGPSLKANYQGAIPPLRDNYQTSAFLATQLAISGIKNSKAVGNSMNYVAHQLLTPRIFEIERGGDVRSFAGPVARVDSDIAETDRSDEPNSSPCYQSEHSTYCDDFRPSIESPIPELSEKLGFGTSALMTDPWAATAMFLTENGEGEPIAMLQGVSVWPTVLLRIFGIVLGLYFVWRAERSLHNNLWEIAKRFNLPMQTPVELTGIKGVLKEVEYSFSYLRPRKKNKVKDFGREDVVSLWQNYLCHETFFGTFIRANFYTVSMFMITVMVIVPLFGFSSIPARGHIARTAFLLTSNMESILTFFLAFFIFDSIYSCLQFVKEISHCQTKWPIQTEQLYQERLGLGTVLVSDLIDIELVAERTRCIAPLIYYPFVLNALFILSRSTVFANYAPSLSIIVAQAISMTIVGVCGFVLWNKCEELRTIAKGNISDALGQATVGWANGAFDERQKASRIVQLELLLRRVTQMRDGAFSPFTQQPIIRALLLLVSSVALPILVDLIGQLIRSGIITGL